MSNLRVNYKDGDWLFETTEGHTIRGVVDVRLETIEPDRLLTMILTVEVAEVNLEGVEVEAIEVIE